ncbi:hypothetical protein O9992_29425 [Vibrio lentus]|nr:hypothetical protein [Vibrio lentus]
MNVSNIPDVADFIKIGKGSIDHTFMYQWIQGESLAEKMARHTPKVLGMIILRGLYINCPGARGLYTRGVTAI